MRSLSASELLNVWERGLSQSPIQRALVLLSVAYPDLSTDQLLHINIGQRDSLLLTMREQIFGSQFVSVVGCPQCGDRLELAFATADIRVPVAVEAMEVRSLNVMDYTVQFRLPNSLDLAALLQVVQFEDVRPSDEVMTQWLLDRCLLAAHCSDAEQSISTLPLAVVEAVVDAMAEADPQADVHLDLNCPACGHPWQATFDIVSYFWNELHTWATRMLRDVHILASTYGWQEADILAMSAQRRQVYLEMIGG